MKKVSSGAKVRKTIGNIFVYLILTVLSVIWLFPIVWIVLISFKKDKGMYMSTLSQRNTGSATIRNCLLILT